MWMSLRNQHPCCLFNLGKGLMKTLESWWGFLFHMSAQAIKSCGCSVPEVIATKISPSTEQRLLWKLVRGPLTASRLYWSIWTTLEEFVCEKILRDERDLEVYTRTRSKFGPYMHSLPRYLKVVLKQTSLVKLQWHSSRAVEKLNLEHQMCLGMKELMSVSNKNYSWLLCSHHNP